jgi:hypothetical protein
MLPHLGTCQQGNKTKTPQSCDRVWQVCETTRLSWFHPTHIQAQGTQKSMKATSLASPAQLLLARVHSEHFPDWWLCQGLGWWMFHMQVILHSPSPPSMLLCYAAISKKKLLSTKISDFKATVRRQLGGRGGTWSYCRYMYAKAFHSCARQTQTSLCTQCTHGTCWHRGRY